MFFLPTTNLIKFFSPEEKSLSGFLICFQVAVKRGNDGPYYLSVYLEKLKEVPCPRPKLISESLENLIPGLVN